MKRKRRRAEEIIRKLRQAHAELADEPQTDPPPVTAGRAESAAETRKKRRLGHSANGTLRGRAERVASGPPAQADSQICDWLALPARSTAGWHLRPGRVSLSGRRRMRSAKTRRC